MSEKILGADAAAVAGARSASEGEAASHPGAPQASSYREHSAWVLNSFIVRRDEMRAAARGSRRRFSERHSHFAAAHRVADAYDEAAEVFQRHIEDVRRAVADNGAGCDSTKAATAASASAKDNPLGSGTEDH